MKFFFLIQGLSLYILTVSCSKELRYSKEELYKLVQKADPTMTFILPRSLSDGINCREYSEGCISGHTAKVKGLEIIAVEFMREEDARRAAVKYKGLYLRNWFFDDVTGEPILERFMMEKLKAKKP